MGKYDRVDTMCPVAKDIDLKGALESVDSMKTVVGNASAGLVKDVDDLQTSTASILAAPAAGTATIDASTKKIVTVPFDRPIFVGVGTAAADIKSKITVATDGATFSALGASDTVAVGGKNLVVTFDVALTLATNKIKIAVDALITAQGTANAEITTNAIDAT
jgi:hypothetical protein